MNTVLKLTNSVEMPSLYYCLILEKNHTATIEPVKNAFALLMKGARSKQVNKSINSIEELWCIS